MDKVFHYLTIRVLAQEAGFPPAAAQTIAYASQYADRDRATEHKKMKIAGAPAIGGALPRYHSGTFDPICTAHWAKSWFARLRKWAKFYLSPKVQLAVLMPFHFVPPRPGEDLQSFSFVTEQEGALATEIVTRATDVLAQEQVGSEGYEYGLVKLGLALHTYADTWAHAGFSGRHSGLENDIGGLRVGTVGSRLQPVGLGLAVVSYVAPDVGHAEAPSTPDLAHVQWTAKYSDRKNPLKRIERDNTTLFLNAAAVIYRRLVQVAPKRSTAARWRSLEAALRRCYELRDTWENTFANGGVPFYFHRFEWREAALSGDSVDWDGFDSERDFRRLSFKYTGRDKRWFMFHKAAFEQRQLVTSQIPNSWPA